MAGRNKLGAVVRDWMADEGITSLRELAAHLGVAVETARQLLEGGRAPSEQTLAKTATALRMPVTEVRRLAGSPTGERAPFELPPEADQLDEQQRAVVLGVVRSLLDASRAATGHDEQGWAARPRRGDSSPG